MLEIDKRFIETESLVQERKRLTNEDLVGMFGANYKQLIEHKAVQLGINERLQFFDSAKPHDGSQAVYIVEQFVGNDWILASVLEPNMETSKHHHRAPMIREKYLHIAGESFVSLDGKEFPLNSEQNLIEVPLDIIHQVRTQENPSLTLIIMENARLVAPGKLHVKLP